MFLNTFICSYRLLGNLKEKWKRDFCIFSKVFRSFNSKFDQLKLIFKKIAIDENRLKIRFYNKKVMSEGEILEIWKIEGVWYALLYMQYFLYTFEKKRSGCAAKTKSCRVKARRVLKQFGRNNLVWLGARHQATPNCFYLKDLKWWVRSARVVSSHTLTENITWRSSSNWINSSRSFIIIYFIC